ncbi:MAG: SAM-dependent methyltransferase [Verrucomicrobiaceae bacterium]|nr:MAG: SAM-dependent methyltransferase [Verrucomicrobiaceae bacterium]
MERAELYGAKAVFFEGKAEGRSRVAQAFIFVESHVDEDYFAEIHGRLWSWGGVPLAYLVEGGSVRLFRCAHKPDFESVQSPKFRPFSVLTDATKISSDPWWSKERLRDGSIWDDRQVANELLRDGASQKELIEEVGLLFRELKASQALPEPLLRKLLVLSLMIAYLEARKVLLPKDFGKCVHGATKFFEVLRSGTGLLSLLEDLEKRFNGNVFELKEQDRDLLRRSDQLEHFARLVEGRDTPSGQRTLWERYSFADLPVELISQTYQLFVEDSDVAVYTPQALVRLMVIEALSPERLERLHKKGEVILDPACGSGVFLVESYKRLVLHWRSKRAWRRPSKEDLRTLLNHIRGVDLDEGAVELASFSLCLALCDALEPESMRADEEGLFPKLIGEKILRSCFFEVLEKGGFAAKVGVVVGNPPFKSAIPSGAAQRLYDCYRNNNQDIPDKQIAFLFLHESMELLQEGGVLSLLQGANFLYNSTSKSYRQKFFKRWDVREILDFTSVRGMFKGGNADPKVVVVVAEAKRPTESRPILHATFRRTHRAKAKLGFDIDYYDLHWIPRQIVQNDGVWRSNLFGGARVLQFVDRIKTFPTIQSYVKGRDQWDCGEGFITGNPRRLTDASHIAGKPLLPSDALTEFGVDREKIIIAPDVPIEEPRRERLFTPPMVLIDEQFNLNHGYWDEYLTYKHQIVGIRGPRENEAEVREIDSFLTREKKTLQAYVAATSSTLFTRQSTTLSGGDIKGLPYPPEGSLNLSFHETVIVDDIVDHYRDLIRFGDDSGAMRKTDAEAKRQFSEVFVRQVNAVHKESQLRPLTPYVWKKSEVICQPFVFGDREVDWEGVDELWEKIGTLLQGHQGALDVTRIARLYDGACIYLLKPDRLRYWLRSTALRDADEVLADLWDAGY